MMIYHLLIFMAYPIVGVLCLIRVLKGRESLSDCAQRLGLARPNIEQTRRHLWVHAASNGELSALRPILQMWQKQYPEIVLFITSNSLSARALAKSWGFSAALAPFDTYGAARRLMRHLNAIGHITSESEIWPNRLSAARETGFTALLGARMGAKTAEFWQRFPIRSEKIFADFDLIAPQDEASKQRLLELGARPSTMLSSLNLKAFYQPSSSTDPFNDWPFKRACTWLAASSHPGEEEIILAAHRLVQEQRPDFKLILAPRHPQRGEEVWRLAITQKMRIARYGSKTLRDTDVLLVDKLGVMQHLYPKAAICFVAGSLVPKGGHTPYEPIYFKSAVLHGPHTDNFAEAYQALRACEGTKLVSDHETLAQAVLQCAAPEIEKQLSNNAAQLQPYKQALDQLFEKISALQSLK